MGEGGQKQAEESEMKTLTAMDHRAKEEGDR